MNGSAVRIITFHVKTDCWAHNPHPLGGRKPPHSDLIPFFLSSAGRSNKTAVVEVVTDHGSVFKEPFHRVWRRQIDVEALMLERLIAQRDLLEAGHCDDRIAFLDTDVLILKDLKDVLDTQFDIGVTIRDEPVYQFERVMPYNNGVIFVSLRNKDAVLSYFDLLLKRLKERDKTEWAWSGNQFVVRDTLGAQPVGQLINVAGAAIRVFPCSTHNYTPREPGEVLTNKTIAHFRGEAKDLMAAYAAEYGV